MPEPERRPSRADIARQRREERSRCAPRPTYDDSLPVAQRRAEIIEAIRAHQVIILCGETGSGKSTQLPKLCLEAGRGIDGLIGHTQPRRIAARSIAARVAQELGVAVGREVGFKIRFGDRTSRDTYIKVMTDGVLLSETTSDRDLRRYDTIIVDEAHERSLNIDFLLGYLRHLLPRRPDLKLIITSATIDPERFAEHFDGAPIISVSGRTYPVEMRYRPPESDDPEQRDLDINDSIIAAVDELSSHDSGDILVFLPGEREIREATNAMRKHRFAGQGVTEILPLYARLSNEEQSRVFAAHKGRRVVLATNVAETSLTVPGIRHVVDTGLVRLSRYSPRTRVQGLPIERVSRASADQRAGRCGRVAPGVCIRLYQQKEYDESPRYTDPEILRTGLASVILRMADLRLGAVDRFPFIDPPAARLIRDGYDTLHELGAMTERRELSDIGRRLAKLPIEPRLGRMLLAAESEGSLTEALVIASALSIQDPRERPAEKRDQADAAHAEHAHEESDFLTLLALWNTYHDKARHLSSNKLKKWCRDRFLSMFRMREWHDIHSQLKSMMTEHGGHLNTEPASYDAVHRALLAGLLSGVARLDERGEYEGTHATRFFIHPGSGQFSARPKWIVTGERVRTTKLYARMVARIDASWIDSVGAHLVRKSHSEPSWDEERGGAFVLESRSILSLTYSENRRVALSSIDRSKARAMFIHHALVEGQWSQYPPFRKHNDRVIAEVREDEARMRRRDLLIDPMRLEAFYDRRLPADACDAPTFEKWRSRIERTHPKLLFMGRSDIVPEDAGSVDERAFPKRVRAGSTELAVDYRHDPGAPADGVTIRTPVAALGNIDAATADWLIPGLVRDRAVELIKSLPRSIRSAVGPAPDAAELFLSSDPARDVPLTESLERFLRQLTGLEIPAGVWAGVELPQHVRPRFEVRDEQNRTIAEGRDLARLKSDLAQRIRSSVVRAGGETLASKSYNDWTFDDLAESVEVGQGKAKVRAFPALIDKRDAVSIELLETATSAARAHALGLRRLYELKCRREIKYHLDVNPQMQKLRVRFAPYGSAGELRDQLALLVCARVFSTETRPTRLRGEFEQRLDREWHRIGDETDAACTIAHNSLTLAHDLDMALSSKLPASAQRAAPEIAAHRKLLLRGRMFADPPSSIVAQFPRYLQCDLTRLDRLRHGKADLDSRRAEEFTPRWDRLIAVLSAEHEDTQAGEHLRVYRWMLEEYRVQVFAPELGTAMAVSPKKIDEQWDRIVRAAQG
ncbi:MAG: ATP-dependent RNA helicase HrpA [Phycisphaeraceae bacterium]|nr:ATP-dependent RNA helicase HrpA [Phycisphaeraceae bacterium]